MRPRTTPTGRFAKNSASRSPAGSSPTSGGPLPPFRSERIRKRPWRDGTAGMVFEPLDFLAKLAVLVPPARMNTIRFHGVYVPNAKLRSCVVPLTDDKSCRPGIDQASVSSLHGLPSERLRRIEGSTRYSTTALRKSAMMSPPPASRADVAGPIPCGTLRSMSSSGGFPVTIPHPRPRGTGRPCGSWLPFADLGSPRRSAIQSVTTNP